MWWSLITTLLLLAACGLISALNDPRVTLDQGLLRGKTIKSRGGKKILTFRGIPYAAPPVGNLRFKDPQEAAAWSGERVAHREGSDCPQRHFLLQKYNGKEDCLYLNVFTPKLEREGSGLPVMVWVHGGAFFSGSGSSEMYGPELLLDHDIVLVNINYRLGALGFLSLGTPEAPGNYGLKDQVAALRWVQNNVAKFGGNPDSVTIFGESAGGASIHYLMLSPLARGLFHRAIAQSGSAHNPWAFESDAASQGVLTAARAGCEQQHLGELLECLRGVDAQHLIDVSADIQAEEEKLSYFVPSIEPANTEGAFLTEDPRSMLARGGIADVPFMAGLMTHEGMLQLMLLKNKTVEQDYTKHHARYVPAAQLGVEPKTPDWTAAWLRIENFYSRLGDGEFLEQYLLLNSDVDFVLGVDDLVRGVAALRRSPVYYYQFSYDGGLALIKRLAKITRPGTAHGDELTYLFSPAMMASWKTAPAADHLTIDRVTKLWTDFAKSGSPTPDGSLGVHWRPVEAPLGKPDKAVTHYLDIGSQLVMKGEQLNAARVEFWRELHQLFRERKQTVNDQSTAHNEL